MLGERGLLLAGIFAITLSGCASMTSSKEELQNIGENEGVVVGSFAITVEKGEGAESGWAFLLGQKAGDAIYTVHFAGKGVNPFSPTYKIRARPGKEEVFIKKLPAGDYEIRKIAKEGFTTLELNLRDVTFRVVPKQTTYIGTLTLQFPDRIMAGSRVRVTVGDAQQETTESLRGEHGPSLSRVVTELMTGGEISEPIPELSQPQSAGLGIDVTVKAPLSFISTTSDQIYFAVIDGEEGLFQQKLIPSNYVKGGRAYLLNARPGTYVAVAASRIAPGMTTSRASYMTYFSKELVEQSKVTVRENEFVFMGKYVVGASVGLEGADEVQTHYKNVIAPGVATGILLMGLGGDISYSGALLERKNDEQARNEFIRNATEDLVGSAWAARLK